MLKWFVYRVGWIKSTICRGRGNKWLPSTRFDRLPSSTWFQVALSYIFPLPIGALDEHSAPRECRHPKFVYIRSTSSALASGKWVVSHLHCHTSAEKWRKSWAVVFQTYDKSLEGCAVILNVIWWRAQITFKTGEILMRPLHSVFITFRKHSECEITVAEIFFHVLYRSASPKSRWTFLELPRRDSPCVISALMMLIWTICKEKSMIMLSSVPSADSSKNERCMMV